MEEQFQSFNLRRLFAAGTASPLFERGYLAAGNINAGNAARFAPSRTRAAGSLSMIACVEVAAEGKG
jgi:hypothetical protein